MPKTINIKCPCGAVVNHVYQPDSWPKDKVTSRYTTCPYCKKKFKYNIVAGRCTSWYM